MLLQTKNKFEMSYTIGSPTPRFDVSVQGDVFHQPPSLPANVKVATAVVKLKTKTKKKKKKQMVSTKMTAQKKNNNNKTTTTTKTKKKRKPSKKRSPQKKRVVVKKRPRPDIERRSARVTGLTRIAAAKLKRSISRSISPVSSNHPPSTPSSARISPSSSHASPSSRASSKVASPSSPFGCGQCDWSLLEAAFSKETKQWREFLNKLETKPGKAEKGKEEKIEMIEAIEEEEEEENEENEKKKKKKQKKKKEKKEEETQVCDCSLVFSDAFSQETKQWHEFVKKQSNGTTEDGGESKNDKNSDSGSSGSSGGERLANLAHRSSCPLLFSNRSVPFSFSNNSTRTTKARHVVSPRDMTHSEEVARGGDENYKDEGDVGRSPHDIHDPLLFSNIKPKSYSLRDSTNTPLPHSHPPPTLYYPQHTPRLPASSGLLPGPIAFVNVPQYLRDVRNYMTLALSGHVVEQPCMDTSEVMPAPMSPMVGAAPSPLQPSSHVHHQTVPQTVPQAAPQTAPQAAPQEAPQAAPQTVHTVHSSSIDNGKVTTSVLHTSTGSDSPRMESQVLLPTTGTHLTLTSTTTATREELSMSKAALVLSKSHLEREQVETMNQIPPKKKIHEHKEHKEHHHNIHHKSSSKSHNARSRSTPHHVKGLKEVDDHHMDSVTMDASHGHNHEDVHGAGAVVVPPPEQQPISQKEKKKIKKKNQSTVESKHSLLGERIAKKMKMKLSTIRGSTMATRSKRRPLHEPRSKVQGGIFKSIVTKKSATGQSVEKEKNGRRVKGSKVNNHMDSVTMNATRGHNYDYVHGTTTTTNRMPQRLAHNTPPRRSSSAGVSPASPTSPASSPVSPARSTTMSVAKGKGNKSSKKGKRGKRNKQVGSVAVSGSWGRLLSTALGLAGGEDVGEDVGEDDEENGIIQSRVLKTKPKQNSKINRQTKQPRLFANGLKGAAATAAAAATATATATATADPVGTMFEQRELYPRESIVMMHLLCFEQIQTHKQLPLVQRIIDGLAGFLMKEKNGHNSGKSAAVVGKKSETAKIDLKTKTKTKTKRFKRIKKSAGELFSSNLSKIEEIFLQLPVTVDGQPNHAAENEGQECPQWCDVGVKMKTTIKFKKDLNHHTKSDQKSKTRSKDGKGRVVLATPVLMPIRKRSGKCLIPPLKKCVYDFTDRNETFASVGRVVRFYLTKDIVDRIKVKLADYRTMYQSEDENENEDEIDGEVKSTETDDTAAEEIKLQLPETVAE